MMNKTLKTVCACFWLTAMSVQAAETDDMFQATRGELVLKSTATATWMVFVDVYDAGLYADSVATPETILSHDSVISLEIRYRVDVKKSQLIEAAEVALSRQHDVEKQLRFQDDVIALHNQYRNVTEGDRFRIDIHPERGLTLSFNDNEVYQNGNLAFAHYYIGLWLAENPLSDKVRNALLQWNS
jgi:hypothetical protein